VSSTGGEANDDTFSGWLSHSGRVATFVSEADDLVPGDANDNYDVFVRDRQTGVTTMVSVTPGGMPVAGASFGGPMSTDDGLILFASDAPDVVAGDGNGAIDVFVRDLVAGVTSRVSVASDGTEGDATSGLGDLSADGHVALFWSDADNLVPGDTNGVRDAFVRDLDTGTTTRVTVAAGDGQTDGLTIADALSADGRIVVMSSYATNLVTGDGNGVEDVFVYDRDTGDTTRVSVATDGTEANAGSFGGAVSADGRRVVFVSFASNLVAGDSNGAMDVFVHDRDTGVTTRVSVASDGSEGNGTSDDGHISGDGRFVAFRSAASNLVPGDTNGVADVFIRDLDAGTTTRVSVDSAGSPANAASDSVRISDDGRVVEFRSFATNLVGGDGNAEPDTFVHDRYCGDGVVDPGEQCDDGNDVGGDGCENDCVPTICTGGTTIAKLKVVLKRLGGVAADEQLAVTGRLVLAPGVPATVDPAADGAQIRVTDLGVPGAPILALTSLTTPVPSGPRGAACAPRDGWATRPGSWAYANASGALNPPACTPGSAHGLTGITFKDKRATHGSIDFSAKTKNAPLAVPVGPLRAEIVLGGQAMAGAAGACGAHSLPASSCTTRSGTMTCK